MLKFLITIFISMAPFIANGGGGGSTLPEVLVVNNDLFNEIRNNIKNKSLVLTDSENSDEFLVKVQSKKFIAFSSTKNPDINVVVIMSEGEREETPADISINDNTVSLSL